MIIEALDRDFTICRVKDYSRVNFESEFVFIGRTDEENSLVCLSGEVPENIIAAEDGWKAMRICGTLDFSLIGILSGICKLLADENISLFAISTYNTDYILTKSECFEKALRLLKKEGYGIIIRNVLSE